jgi:thioredoxin 1
MQDTLTQWSAVMAHETTDANFENDVLKSDIPVLVDFWAEWCGPCKQLTPVIEELSNEFEGKIKVCKVNIDQHPETPAKYNVRGIPTLIIFKDGNPTATKVGALPKSALIEWVSSVVNA